jgi:heme-degrading monooxygenase HmoA
MAVVMNMRWNGVTPEQYDEARRRVNWEGDRPVGGNFHVSSFDGDALRVTDIWDSAEDFQRFVDSRLMPVVQEIGIQGQPEVVITPVHAIYAPAFD